MTGRREAAKAHTRSVIIETAIRLMYEHGYDATSTTSIAQAAGVSPATLFNYFPTKTSIIFADDDLWAPQPGPIEAGATPQQTLQLLMLSLLNQPGWTRPADDPLTLMRFELVRREPALIAAQTAHAFGKVPIFANALRHAHPDLSDDEALAHAGATVGAVLAALLWSPSDIHTSVQMATQVIAGSESSTES